MTRRRRTPAASTAHRDEAPTLDDDPNIADAQLSVAAGLAGEALAAARAFLAADQLSDATYECPRGCVLARVWVTPRGMIVWHPASRSGRPRTGVDGGDIPSWAAALLAPHYKQPEHAWLLAAEPSPVDPVCRPGCKHHLWNLSLAVIRDDALRHAPARRALTEQHIV